MAQRPSILGFAGSTRRDSVNKKLVRVAIAGAADAGADVTEIDFADFPMPLYDADLHAREGFPEHAKAFKDLVAASDGLLISTPEYNHGISGVLKNAIDWASRRAEGEAVTSASFQGKVAGIMSAAPGIYGGVRGLLQLRMVLTGVRVLILPEQLALTVAKKAFDDDGGLVNAELEATARGIGARLCAMLEKLSE